MLDRQDIDALLIGSLYGELSSTEEARLAAHLDSHPADRTALADLTRARAVVRESRILQFQFEPPQSISALLMQEAVRRAPKPADEMGWFQRFMRSFMAHPAMAAAVMLVLVAGVAGTMYLRNGDQFANQYKDEAPATTAPASNEELSRQRPELAQGSAAAVGEDAAAVATDEYHVQLHDREDDLKKQDTVLDGDGLAETKAEPTKGEGRTKSGELAFEGAKNNPVPKDTVATKPAKQRKYLEVTTPSQTPKEMPAPAEEKTLAKESVAGMSDTSIDHAGAGRTATPKPAPTIAKPPTSKAPANKPADVKVDAKVTSDRGVSPPPPQATPATPEPDSAEKQEKKLSDADRTWAIEQHKQLQAAVKANRCDTAAAIAIQIANRTPSYYAANVENDRAVKGCLALINAQREKELERNQRAKATQRRADENAAPAPAKK